jgi:hypothetical protein
LFYLSPCIIERWRKEHSSGKGGGGSWWDILGAPFIIYLHSSPLTDLQQPSFTQDRCPGSHLHTSNLSKASYPLRHPPAPSHCQHAVKFTCPFSLVLVPRSRAVTCFATPSSLSKRLSGTPRSTRAMSVSHSYWRLHSYSPFMRILSAVFDVHSALSAFSAGF